MNKQQAQLYANYFASKYLKNLLPDEVLSEMEARIDQADVNDQTLVKHWEQQVARIHHWENVGNTASKNQSVDDYLSLIKQALLENKKVWLGYESKDKRFKLNPFGLVERDQQYFLVGSLWDFDNPLLYAVRRIKHLNIDEQTAIKPPADFCLQEFASDYLNHPHDEMIDELVLEFPKSIQSYFEDYPLKCDSFEFEDVVPDEQVRMMAYQVQNSKRLQQLLSGFHGRVHIKAPDPNVSKLSIST